MTHSRARADTIDPFGHAALAESRENTRRQLEKQKKKDIAEIFKSLNEPKSPEYS